MLVEAKTQSALLDQVIPRRGSPKHFLAARTSHATKLLLVLLLALPAVVQAQFTFTTNGGAITITGYTGSGGAVVIPSETNGLPVTGIGNSAFYNKSSVTSVMIPNSVTSLGDSVFKSCISLSNVVISSSVTSIGAEMFRFCYQLASVAIPDSVTNIGARAFFLSTGLTGVYFRGDAPFADSLAFASTISTVYWLPGTLRWGLMFAERPTALWLPKLQSSDGSFGVRTNQFGFNISWASGMNIAVDACTNLATLDWVPLQTNTLTADTFYFSDPDWADHPRRFYRVRWP